MRATWLCLLAAGCAHWGTLEIGEERSPSEGRADTTYVAAPRPALPTDVDVEVSTDPPPAGAVVLAVVKVACGDDGCLGALRDAARHVGGNAAYGAHLDVQHWRRGVSRSLVATVAATPEVAPAPPAVRTVSFDLVPDIEVPALDVYLERREPSLGLGDETLESWSRLCKLPCAVAVAPGDAYRLDAPELPAADRTHAVDADEDQVHVQTRVSHPDYGRVWLGLGMFLVAGGLVGGTGVYYAANRNTSSGLAELTVGLTLLPCVFYGLAAMVAGPERHLAMQVDGG